MGIVVDKITKKVLLTIDKFDMIKKGQTVIAAVSGGYDSICMLHILKSLMPLRKFDLCAAHVDHQFRKQSASDRQFVESFAASLGIECYTKSVDVQSYAGQNKISFETAGREIRYNFFEEIASKFDDPVIATGHNAKDSVESFMMHLMRGSGLSGLSGIKPVRGNVIRPLIELDRDEIEGYCHTNNLRVVHDYTNESDDYARNDIRHNIVEPMLKRCSSGSLLRTMQVITEEDRFLTEYTGLIADKYTVTENNKIKISLTNFNKLDVTIKRRLLKRIIPNTGMQTGFVHIDNCIKMAEKNHGGKRIVFPGRIYAEINKGILIISEVQTNEK